ncbi:hypothetical protein IFM89_019356 [Coptis chinensis]|uniref:Exocyst complex component Sec8 n=1 Tax=Coptis chinensis TaxID=261450 RepID=A0A835IZJ0_9MAGN|nr:hypothetical protein IFM89_019356 [Coptis chinensis]
MGRREKAKGGDGDSTSSPSSPRIIQPVAENPEVIDLTKETSKWLNDNASTLMMVAGLNCAGRKEEALELFLKSIFLECILCKEVCIVGSLKLNFTIFILTSQRLRPTIHEIITSKIKAHAATVNSSRPGIGQAARTSSSGLHYIRGQQESCRPQKQKRINGMLLAGTVLAVSPVSPVMAPLGAAQAAAKELLDSMLDSIIRILENHVVVGELLESKSAQSNDMITPKSTTGDVNWNPDPEASQLTGGYSVGFSLTVLQSECQQLICEILRSTPEAASADAAVQTARLASKVPFKEKRQLAYFASEVALLLLDGLFFVIGVDLIRQGWSRRGPNVLQEGYGTAAVLPEQGIYLAASIYRPVLQFTDKVASLLPQKYSQLGNDGLLAFVENFLKDHFLPTMFVDYRKGVNCLCTSAINASFVFQFSVSSLSQVISYKFCIVILTLKGNTIGPAAFRPRAHGASTYSPLIEKGRPVLQGLLAIDFLSKEILGWARAMPKYAGDLVKYVQTFLERTYERCRTSYMEAVLEKQSYMLIGRHDVEGLMRLDPSSACLPNSSGKLILENNGTDAETVEVEIEMSDLLLSLRPIKQENLIRDDNKLILLASLSDSLEYVADSIERLGQTSLKSSNKAEESQTKGHRHTRTSSAATRDLASFAEEYRRLAIDCLKVLRVEMQLETIFHIQEMTSRGYVEDQDAEEPDDFIISLTAQALADMKSINLFGVQQICRNSIALEQLSSYFIIELRMLQALAAIPSINSEAVQQRLDRVRTYYELLNLPFEVNIFLNSIMALLAFITEHEYLFTAAEYSSLLKVQVPGREIPGDAEKRVSEILSH